MDRNDCFGAKSALASSAVKNIGLVNKQVGAVCNDTVGCQFRNPHSCIHKQVRRIAVLKQWAKCELYKSKSLFIHNGHNSHLLLCMVEILLLLDTEARSQFHDCDGTTLAGSISLCNESSEDPVGRFV